MDQSDRVDRRAAPADASVLWLAGGKVVDVVAGRLTRQNVRLENGQISDLTGANPPSGADTIDLGGRFIAPGLINSHTHLQGRYPYALRREDEHPGVTAIRASAHAERLLHAGVTTVRCLHEQARADIAVREAARSGWSLAPTIMAAGRALSTPRGHGARQLGTREAQRGLDQTGQSLSDVYDPIDRIDGVQPDSKRRIFIVGDPRDRSVGFESQKEFQQKLAAAGISATVLTAEAKDKMHHRIAPEAQRVAGWCKAGMGDTEIQSRLDKERATTGLATE